jgi:hypothetical protein
MSGEKTKAFERAALAGLCTHLSSGGLPSRIVSHPEDDPDDLLTVDARLDVAGIAFAADHSRVQYDNRRIPAERSAERYLIPRLDAISRQAGCPLHVQMCAPRWTRDEPRPLARYEEVIKLASTAASNRKAMERGDLRVVVQPGVSTEPSSISFIAEDDPLSLRFKSNADCERFSSRSSTDSSGEPKSQEHRFYCSWIRFQNATVTERCG